MKSFPLKFLTFMALGISVLGCNKKESLPTESYDTPKELESLTWLVGDWKDDEAGLDVTFEWKWDLDHRFLVQHFESKQTDESNLSGTQILGWDPIEKMVRSWTFDSDGGFGESRWEQNENNWYVQTSYVQSSGVKASATYVYKKIDNGAFTFSSEVRDVDGEILPDAGPFKFVRR